MSNRTILALIIATMSFSLILASTPPVQASPGPRLTVASTKVVPAGTLTTTNVRVSFMTPFDAFDISVRADAAAISPESISIGTMLSSPFILSNCVNGSGIGCSINDGSGVAHLAAASGTGLPSSAFKGVLFTITWLAVNNIAGSPIVISCQLFAIAGSQVHGILVVDTDYGIVSGSAEPALSVSSLTSSISVPAGSSKVVQVNVNGTNGWANDLNLTVTTSSPSVTATLSPTVAVCDCVTTVPLQLTISTTSSGTATVTVTGSFVFHGTKLSSSFAITVTS